MPLRDYGPLLAQIVSTGDRLARMSHACDLVWTHFGLDQPARPAFSWIGFYEKSAGDDMILVARRNKPACSPIGLHGMCGRSWSARRPLLVADATKAQGGYIACDPNDKGEIVIPIMNPDGSCWGVLDGDSYEANAFDDADVAGLTALVERLGLSAPAKTAGATLVL